MHGVAENRVEIPWKFVCQLMENEHDMDTGFANSIWHFMYAASSILDYSSTHVSDPRTF